MKKYITVLKMTGLDVYMLSNLMACMLYIQVCMSEKIMMAVMSPVYVITIYHILWLQYRNYNVTHKDILNIVPLTEKAKSKCYNFSIISNIAVCAVIMTARFAADCNRMCYWIVPDFIIITSVFYGTNKLETDNTGKTVLYILIGLATSVIFILEGGILL